MSKFAQILPKDLIKALQKGGFFILRQTGSHIRLGHHDGKKITVALHTKSIPKGTLTALLKQAEISKEQIEQLLK